MPQPPDGDEPRPLPPLPREELNRVPHDTLPMWRIEYYRVGQWSSQPAAANAPPEGLMFELKLASVETPVGLLLRTPRAVDQLVRVLRWHRNELWPHAVETE